MTGAVRVLDASVVLAAIFGELTADEAEYWLLEACISTVNLAEVVTKLSERGFSPETIANGIANFNLEAIPFDRGQAERAGLLRSDTRHLGLSLGDRACLATATELDLPAATADRSWAELDLGIAIEVIR